MANDIKIKGSHPISENLSTITVGDQASCLEISDRNGARITGDLEVTGSIIGIDEIVIHDLDCQKITGTPNLALVGGDISLPFVISASTKTASTAFDATLYIFEILNLSSGAGGSDVHYGIKYAQNQADLTGWDKVYLMHISGGTDAKTFAIQGDGKVGIGVTDPDSLLEIFGESAQLKLSWDASNHAAITVADDGHLEFATTGDDADLTLDAAGDIILDAADGDVTILQADLTIPVDKKVIFGNTGEYIVGDNTDLDIVSSNDATIDAGGTIILDSADGTFEMHGAGATAKFADMYAGLILGYTDIGLNESHTTLSLTTSYVVPTDEFSVSFVAPPSGNVLIDIQIQSYAGSGGAGDLFAGLSSANATTGYAQLEDEHEKRITDGAGRFGVNTDHVSWTLTALTAGTSYEYWAGFKSTSTLGTPSISWGGSATGRYPDFIMKATALPATIYTG